MGSSLRSAPLIALVSLGCPAAPADAPAAAGTALPVAPQVVPDEPGAAPPPTPIERPARRAVTDAERTALRAFRAEMQVGRTKTRAGAHAEAIAAFDRALGHRPNDPRALAERGYARLLAGDLDGARIDLERARQRTQDPARLGPIWFNVGLVAEASGNLEGARRAFTLSNELRPTRAAAARLSGAPACTAEIDRTPKSAARFPSWRALHEHLAQELSDGPSTLRRDDEIRAAMCHDRKRDGDGLWDLCFGNSEIVNSHASILVGRARDGALLLFGELLFAESGACQPYGVLTVTPIGDLHHARHVQFGMDWQLVATAPDNPDAVPCDGDGDDLPESCEFACTAFSADVSDFIVDLTGGRQLLRIRRTTHAVTTDDPRRLEESLATDVTVTDRDVTLRGGGCDVTVPIDAPVPLP